MKCYSDCDEIQPQNRTNWKTETETQRPEFIIVAPRHVNSSAEWRLWIRTQQREIEELHVDYGPYMGLYLLESRRIREPAAGPVYRPLTYNFLMVYFIMRRGLRPRQFGGVHWVQPFRSPGHAVALSVKHMFFSLACSKDVARLCACPIESAIIRRAHAWTPRIFKV